MEIAAMSWTELHGRLSVDDPPPVLLPLGAVEAHGPHLPLDTDTILAEHLARWTADRFYERDHLEVLRAPAVPLSAAAWAKGFPGTVSLSPEAARATLHDALEAMRRSGADRIVLVNLHFDPEHIAAVRDVVKAVRAKGVAGLVFPDFTRRALAARVGGEFLSGSCHGGKFETSMLLAAEPAKVKSIYRGLPRRDVDLAAAIRAGKRSFLEVGLDQAYCGDPGAATAQEGKRLYGLLADLIVDDALAAWGSAKS